jgi:hypothetical protein
MWGFNKVLLFVLCFNFPVSVSWFDKLTMTLFARFTEREQIKRYN